MFAGVGLEGANAPFAEHHIVVAARQDVLRREQQLFDGGGNAALEQHRLARQSKLTQQVEVLHVARAYLKNVHIREHEVDLRDLHHLADDQQAGPFRGLLAAT